MKILIIGFFTLIFLLLPNAFAQTEDNNDGDKILEQGETYGPLGILEDYDYYQDPDGNLIDGNALGERILTCMEMIQKGKISSDISCPYWVLSEEGITKIVSYAFERSIQ